MVPGSQGAAVAGLSFRFAPLPLACGLMCMAECEHPSQSGVTTCTAYCQCSWHRCRKVSALPIWCSNTVFVRILFPGAACAATPTDIRRASRLPLSRVSQRSCFCTGADAAAVAAGCWQALQERGPRLASYSNCTQRSTPARLVQFPPSAGVRLSSIHPWRLRLPARQRALALGCPSPPASKRTPNSSHMMTIT
jgi:hypothetical protein